MLLNLARQTPDLTITLNLSHKFDLRWLIYFSRPVGKDKAYKINFHLVR
jgi:hypothetical protein